MDSQPRWPPGRLYVLRIAEHSGRVQPVICTQNRDMNVGIVTDSHGFGLSAIEKCLRDTACGVNNMDVGQNQTVWCKYKPRARTAAPLTIADVDFKHSRTDPPNRVRYGARIGVEQFAAVARGVESLVVRGNPATIIGRENNIVHELVPERPLHRGMLIRDCVCRIHNHQYLGFGCGVFKPVLPPAT